MKPADRHVAYEGIALDAYDAELVGLDPKRGATCRVPDVGLVLVVLGPTDLERLAVRVCSEVALGGFAVGSVVSPKEVMPVAVVYDANTAPAGLVILEDTTAPDVKDAFYLSARFAERVAVDGKADGPVVDDVDSLMGGTNPDATPPTFESLVAGFADDMGPVLARLRALGDYAKKALGVVALEAVDERMRARNLSTINDELARLGLPRIPDVDPADFVVTKTAHDALEAEVAELRGRIDKASTILCDATVHLADRKDRALDALSEPDQRNRP